MIVDDVANTIRTAIELKLKATPVHTEYDSVKADGVDIVNEMWECPGMRKLHLETGQTEQFGKLSVLHCVLFPDPSYPLPIFGCDIVATPKTVTAAIVDISPVRHMVDMYKDIGEICNSYKFNDRRVLRLWGYEIFSPHCQFLRLKDNQAQLDYHYLLTECLWSFCDRILQSESDPVWQHQMLRMDDQIYYCKQQRKNKKTIAVLSNWFDPLFARKYIDEVLFDIPTK